MHEKHKRTKNKIRIKTINHFNRILSPAGQVDGCSSEDLKSCNCEYEDQRVRMRHLLTQSCTATVTSQGKPVKYTGFHEPKGQLLYQINLLTSLQTSINTEYQFLFFHQNVFILHRKIIFS